MIHMNDMSTYKLSKEDQEFNDKFAKKLIIIITLANEIANKVDLEHGKTAPLEERDEGTIEAIVNSIINVMYYDESKQNYLFLATELSTRLARKHALLDGNKRTAFYTGILIMDVAEHKAIMFKKDTAYYVNAIVDVAADKPHAVDEWSKLLVNEITNAEDLKDSPSSSNPSAYAIWYNKSLSAIKITNSLFNK